MPRVRVVTDSTADLSSELIQRFDLTVIPLYVRLGDQVYRDGVDLQPERLFEYVASTGNLPQTSMPTPADVEAIFRPIIEAGDDIIYVGLSSKLSGTFQAARIAAQSFPSDRIALVDSLNLSTGIGLLALYAAELAAAGLPLPEIAGKVQARVPLVKTSFIIDTLDYLYKGGRCSAMQSIVGSLLRIKPRIEVIDGKLEVAEKLMGSRARALASLLRWCLQDKERIDLHRIFVTHAAYPDGANYLASELYKALPVKEVLVTEAGAVISSHCGPGTVGILYSLTG
ncbi:MAG: DegV family protein [Limnochordales bacterium]|nr:DegV family protein [Limnochordales bacterium]